MVDDVAGPPAGLEASAESDIAAQLELRNVERLEKISDVRTEGIVRAIWHSGWIFVFGMYFAAIVIAASVGLWFWHFLAPEKLGWISEAHLNKIQAVLFSGSMGALLSAVVAKYLGGNGKEKK